MEDLHPLRQKLIKATNLYNTATLLAEAFGDQVFIKNLKMEMEKDLNIE